MSEFAGLFRYLPPAGFLPIKQANARGVLIEAFFNQIPHREPEFIEDALLRFLITQSFKFPPVDINEGEMVWLYKIRQNEHAILEGQPAAPYVVFTTGFMPYLDGARFDIAHWNYGNFA